MNPKLAMICLCVAVFAGCGGEKVKRDPVFPVKGKVTYKGKPVVGADVTFAHEGGKRSAFGRTDDKVPTSSQPSAVMMEQYRASNP